jgi:peptidoglycan/LPS O-acetylase OafA/YrhL
LISLRNQYPAHRISGHGYRGFALEVEEDKAELRPEGQARWPRDQNNSGNRIKTLDGWRGIAILLVLFDHIQYSLLQDYARPWTKTGQHGVTIFFVLSGFLITSKLLEGPISLKRFYLRRFFRLMPAAWTYLGSLLLLDLLTGKQAVSPAGLSACLLFYRNFVWDVGSAVTGHFWSLSLEEQFYLVWPCLLLLAGARRCRWIALVGAIGCAAYRWLFWAHYNNSLMYDQSQVRADALLVGSLLALLLADARVQSCVARWSKLCALPAFVALLFAMARFQWLPPLYECVAISILIAATMLSPSSAFSRLLSLPPLAWLGTVSYSVYLWQEIFMPIGSIWMLCIGLPLFALGSYYFIERPFTRLGHELTRTLIPGNSAVLNPAEV